MIPTKPVRVEPWHGVAAAAVGLAAIGALWAAMAHLLPIAPDFFLWYYQTPRALLAGETRLYDGNSSGYYLPPWGLAPFLPFAGLEPAWAMAGFTLLSIGLVTALTFLHARSKGARRPLVLALLVGAAPYSLIAYFTGTPDALSLLGMVAAWGGVQGKNGWLLGAGIMLALIRPQNCVLTVPALLLGVRYWPPHIFLRAGIPIALVLGVSGLVAGWDWPWRWWTHLAAVPPSGNVTITTYTLLERVGVPLWASGLVGGLIGIATLIWTMRRGLDYRTFALVLCINAMVTPYIRTPSYLVLLALPWTALAARRPALAVLPYLVMLPNVVIPVRWNELGSLWTSVPAIDLLFPLVLAGSLLAAQRPASHEARPTPAPLPHS